MSKIIDITNKLNFKEKPKFKIKDIEVEANSDAVTMLKVAAIYTDGNIKVSDVLVVYNLLFDEENQKKIESLKLDMNDFSTAITEIASGLLGGGEDDEGETPTPATT